MWLQAMILDTIACTFTSLDTIACEFTSLDTIACEFTSLQWIYVSKTQLKSSAGANTFGTDNKTCVHSKRWQYVTSYKLDAGLREDGRLREAPAHARSIRVLAQYVFPHNNRFLWRGEPEGRVSAPSLGLWADEVASRRLRDTRRRLGFTQRAPNLETHPRHSMSSQRRCSVKIVVKQR